MRFHLTDEQAALQETIRGAALDLCPPARRRDLLEATSDFDLPTWDGLMALGLGGLLVPEAFNGVGLGLEEAALAAEALGETATPGPFIGHLLATYALAQSDRASLKGRWLPHLAAGAVATTALGGDGQPGSWTAQMGDASLSGEIPFVMGADKAEVFVVGLSGGGLALVEADAAVSREPVTGTDLTRRLWRVRFDKAPATIIAGPGDSSVQRVADAALVLLAADALGGAEQCLAMTVDYAKQREQFGVVIGQFQALKHQLANMALEIEPARALVWYAAYALDQRLPDASRAAAHAKAHLADRFTSITRAATQAHGGIGYTWDYDLQIWFRRSLFDRAYLGSPSLHRERIAEMSGW
ncbi:MAG TPA: acyl-CoA dehydrogenase family protein [Caulobacteraceae bacterium]|nr:acyl-CoA dehydrogenase family protein [Caulobacteraceae bacterium]